LVLIAFVVCLAAAIWVLVPHELVFAFRGEALLAEGDHEGQARLETSQFPKAWRGKKDGSR